MTLPMGRQYRFGVFELDAATLELRRSGTRVRLAGKPAQLLRYLLDRPGVAVSREELRAALWPEGTWVDFDHGLNNAMTRLRAALSDSSRSARFIETLPAVGYRFVGSVRID
ncbi:MAG TPA: winged helix-turn-helix domain-containing protein, partial [Thermoanaerobaculia bacterium]|nr:winged helix-turn-helix domain-containing protein [Thermoanaerobaculia bacterium]